MAALCQATSTYAPFVTSPFVITLSRSRIVSKAVRLCYGGKVIEKTKKKKGLRNEKRRREEMNRKKEGKMIKLNF